MHAKHGWGGPRHYPRIAPNDQQPESSAAQEVLARYYAPVMGVVYQILGDIGLVDHAVETIFRRTLRSGATTPVAIWRCVVQVIRSYMLRGAMVPVAAHAYDAPIRILHSLAQLEPEGRLLALLYFHEGLDDRQLAAIFDLHIDRVREQLSQAGDRMLMTLEHVDALR